MAFGQAADETHSPVLRVATVLISAGGLAGITSVLLVLFLSQARVFMAMARDGLLPGIFGEIHPRFRTPHVATMVTGGVICVVGGAGADQKARRDGQHRHALGVHHGVRGGDDPAGAASQRHPPLPLPGVWIVGPLGILVNFTLMLFLPPVTWLRLGVWLVVGLVIYFLYSRRHSHLARHLLHEIQEPRDESLDAV